MLRLDKILINHQIVLVLAIIQKSNTNDKQGIEYKHEHTSALHINNES